MDNRPDYDYGEHAELRIYELQDGKEVSTVIYGMERKKELSITAAKHGPEIKVQVETDKTYTLRFVNVQVSAASVIGLKMDGKDSLFRLTGTQELTLNV